MTVVDAHVHLWERHLVEHPWLTPADGVLDADFTTADLGPLLAAVGIDTAVVVQSADSMAETDYLDRIAASTPWIAATVGWLPLSDPGACGAALAEDAHPSMVGVRHLVHTEPDPDWLVRPPVIASLRLVADAGLTLDVPAVFPLHLDHITTVAETVPSLTIVVDHLAKPPIADGTLEPWATTIREVAAQVNVVAKLSGLNTAASPDGWDADDLRPFVDVALEVFGVDRLLFGSDWPVLLANGDYPQVFDATQHLLDELSDDERSRVFGGNAVSTYRLDHHLQHGETGG